MMDILTFYLRTVLKKLVDQGDEAKVTRLIAVKSVAVFLEDLQNDELLSLAFDHLKESIIIFQEFPKTLKKLIKSIGSVWLENESFKARFYSFIILREMIVKYEVNYIVIILKQLSKGYFKNHSDLSWRTFEKQKF